MAKNKKLNADINETIGITDAVYIPDGNPVFGYPEENSFGPTGYPQTQEVIDAKFKVGDLLDDAGKLEADVDAATTNLSIQEILANKKATKNYYLDSKGQIIFKSWDQKDVEDLDDLFKKLGLGTLEQYKGPLQKIFRSAAGDEGPELAFDAGNFGDLVGQAFGKKLDEIAPRINIKDLTDAAREMKSSVFLSALLENSKRMDNAVFMRAILETRFIIIELKNLTNELLKTGLSNPYTAQNAKDIASWRNMNNYLSVLVQEGAVEARLSMQKGAILSNAGKGEFTREELFDGLAIISKDLNNTKGGELPGPEKMTDILVQFDGLANSQIEYAAKQTRARGPNWWDAAAELYVNAKLFHPWTLAINAAGNFTLQLADIAETLVAAGLNKIPGFKSDDGVVFEEFTSYANAILLGSKRGIGQVKHYKETGRTIGNATKIDQRHSGNAISKDLIKSDVIKDTMVGNAMGKSLDVIGTVVNVPKHLMIKQDEFTKGIIFDVELMKIAQRTRSQVLKRTGDVNKADIEFEKIIHLSDPANQKHILAKVEAAMAQRTFQAELPDGIFKYAQKIATQPAIKLILPFYKTIVNIMFETSKRTPLGMVMPSVRRDLKAGGHLRQMAAARMVTGMGFMTLMSDYVYNPGDFGQGEKTIIMTGAPPINKDERKAFYQSGALPYSINFLDEETGKYRSVQYSGLEPMGKLMGFTADALTIASIPSGYGDEGDDIVELAGAWMEVAYNYFSDQSFIQVFEEMDGFFGGSQSLKGKSLNAAYTKALDLFDVGASAFLGRSSKYIPNIHEITNLADGGQDYFDRLAETSKQNFNIQDGQYYNANTFVKVISRGQAESWSEYYDGDIPVELERFYKIYNKIQYESPFYNPELLPELTEFGREVKDPKARSPFATDVVDGDLINNFMTSTGLFLDYSAKKVGPIGLTSDEQHVFIKYMNEDTNGDGESDYLTEMRNTISNPDFLNLGQQYDRDGIQIGRTLQRDELRAVQAKYKSIAERKMLMDESNVDLLRRYEMYMDSVKAEEPTRLDTNIVEGY